MGKQGVRTPTPIRNFTLETKQNAPRLKHRQIADRVVERFGESCWVDRSTIGRMLSNANSSEARSDSSGSEHIPDNRDKTRISTDSLPPHRREEHEEFLISGLKRLGTPYPTQDLPVFLDRSGPMPRIRKDWIGSGLEYPEGLEVRCLEEHLGLEHELWKIHKRSIEKSYNFRESCSRLWEELVQKATDETGLPVRNQWRTAEPLLTGDYVKVIIEEAGNFVTWGTHDAKDHTVSRNMPTHRAKYID